MWVVDVFSILVVMTVLEGDCGSVIGELGPGEY